MFKRIEVTITNALTNILEKIKKILLSIKDFAVSTYEKVLRPFLGGIWMLLKIIMVIAVIYLLLVQYSTAFLEGIEENSPFLIALGLLGFLIVFAGVMMIFSSFDFSKEVVKLLFQIQKQKQQLNKIVNELAEIKLQLLLLNENIKPTEMKGSLDKMGDKLSQLEEKYK
jgi:type VI protein secretion system component VasK